MKQAIRRIGAATKEWKRWALFNKTTGELTWVQFEDRHRSEVAEMKASWEKVGRVTLIVKPEKARKPK